MDAEPSQEVPAFRYHPDPVGTGSVRPGDETCEVCGRARGHVYVGPFYGADSDEPVICPWCIADGTAARRCSGTFTDAGSPDADGVPADVLDELENRTPGFAGWQQEHWLFHCADACAFLGPAGYGDVAPHRDALESLRREHDDDQWSADEIARYVESLAAHGEPTAYLFCCLHCGANLAYSDFT